MTLSRKGSLGGADCGFEGERRILVWLGLSDLSCLWDSQAGLARRCLDEATVCVVLEHRGKFGLETESFNILTQTRTPELPTVHSPGHSAQGLLEEGMVLQCLLNSGVEP